MGIFPSAAAALRLRGMILVEQNDEWAIRRSYFGLASMEFRKTNSKPCSMPSRDYGDGGLCLAVMLDGENRRTRVLEHHYGVQLKRVQQRKPTPAYW